MRTAPTLAGPWSQPAAVYSFPETVPGTDEYDKDNFCYAAKEHVEFSSKPDEIVASYVCNSFTKLNTAMKIYRPEIVRFTIQ